MAARDEIRELIIKNFVAIVRCNERKWPITPPDLVLLESHLNWELAPESVQRWAAEKKLDEADTNFLVEMFQHCFETYTEDLKELRYAVGEDSGMER
jgi:hypothetical protein